MNSINLEKAKETTSKLQDLSSEKEETDNAEQLELQKEKQRQYLFERPLHKVFEVDDEYERLNGYGYLLQSFTVDLIIERLETILTEYDIDNEEVIARGEYIRQLEHINTTTDSKIYLLNETYLRMELKRHLSEIISRLKDCRNQMYDDLDSITFFKKADRKLYGVYLTLANQLFDLELKLAPFEELSSVLRNGFTYKVIPCNYINNIHRTLGFSMGVKRIIIEHIKITGASINDLSTKDMYSKKKLKSTIKNNLDIIDRLIDRLERLY